MTANQLKNILNKIALAVLVSCLSVTTVWPQMKSGERLELLPGTTEFLQKIVDGKRIRELKGRVHFRQGDAHLFCEKATWFFDEERVLLERNVKIDDGEKLLFADFITYFGREMREEARGHVKIVDSTRTIEADQIIFYEEDDRAIAENNVRVTDTANFVTLTGGHGEYFRALDSVIVMINPVMIRSDSTGKEDLRIVGETMTLSQNGDKALVTDNVVITKDTTEARCGEAEYIREFNKFILRKEPRVWQIDQQLSGDTIELYFEDRHLDRVDVLGNAHVVSEADTVLLPGRMNRLTGQQMSINVHENEIETIVIENQATSWYHLIEEGEYKGLNKVIGDKLSLYLADGEIKRILIESDPDVSSGIFYPPGQEKYTESKKKAHSEKPRKPDRPMKRKH